MLGNSKNNRWCCFCKHWFDPGCSALKPRPGRDLYDVNKDMKCKCSICNLYTPAVHNCPKFERKF